VRSPNAIVRARAPQKSATGFASQTHAAPVKPPDIPAKAFPIVGIGASAGGLEAFTQLLKHLPRDTGMGFVLVQHLDPDHESALTQLLTRATSMPVREVADNLRVEPNHVYVIPPRTSLAIAQGVLRLQAREGGRAPHYSIDSFFESLAHDQGERAIGIILSGTASDGTLGMEAIKAEGGITLAQDDSARHDSMPRSAIATGCVDFILSPEAIARELGRIAKHPYVAGPHTPSLPPSQGKKDEAQTGLVSGEQNGFRKILALLRNHSGVDFSLYKPNTVQRRIARRMVLNKVEQAEAYAKLLRGDAKELEALYSDMLINVTSFFRNPAAFDALRHKVFPEFLRQPRDKALRGWVLGCSTGQEAYSLAMSFVQFAEQAGHQRKFQLFATDVNEALLEKGRAGFYARNQVQNLSPEQLRRSFVEEDGGYRVSKALREMVVFARQDVLADPPFSRMDLISCRNLLIYLEPSLQKKILPSFHYALQPEGFLFLGESETIGGFEELFEPVDRKHKIFSRKTGVTPQSHFAPQHPAERRAVHLPARTGAPEGFQAHLDVQREADRVTLTRFSPAGVLVNAHSQIVQFRGETSPFLRPPSGGATFDVLKMAREGLMLPLRAALKKARKENKPVRREAVPVVQNGGKQAVNFEVVPLVHLKEQCCLIFFELSGEQPQRSNRREPGKASSPSLVSISSVESKPAAKGTRLAALERELAETRDYLQSIQEQYEAANEELQSSNEEVTSANEELQSINEELETSKEELESTNEELTTVNDEMAFRNAELNRSNADLQNLHASVSLAILVLTRDLVIRRFTPPAQKLFNLLATDLGRPLSNVRHNLELPDLEQLLREVIDTMAEREQEVQDKNGRWYSLRARPYLTLDKKIDGAVLVLVDIDALKRGAREIEAARDYAQAILRTIRAPLLVLTEDLCVSTANAAFFKQFKAVPGETEGRFVFELGNGQWNIPGLRQLLGEVLARNSSFDDFEVSHDFEGLGRRTMLLNARRLESGGKNGLVLLAIDDITDTRQTQLLREVQAKLQKSNEELERKIQNRTLRLRETVGELEAFSYSISHDMRAPLRSMQGFAHILLTRYKDKMDPGAFDFLERIERSAQRLDRLIQDVLGYAKIVRAQVPIQPVDLKRLVSDLLDAYPELQPPKALIEIKETLPAVLGNQAWLTQCFSNLLSNAVKFVPPGVQPHVTIRAELVTAGAFDGRSSLLDGQISLAEEQPDLGGPPATTPPRQDSPSQTVRIWVEDNGIGIDPKDRERIFRLFERIRPACEYEGTGLGLTIARKAVERMGGQMGLESEPGKGSRFWIQLRKAEPTPSPK
jgi:two-component system CheB/CheR fusion protein